MPGAGVALIDTYGDQTRTDVDSAAAIADGVAAGRLLEPVAQASDSTGMLTATDGALFGCPAPVVRTFVPCAPPTMP